MRIKSIMRKIAFVVNTTGVIVVFALVGLFNLGGGYSDSLNIMYDHLHDCALSVGGTIKHAISAKSDDLDCYEYLDHVMNNIWTQSEEQSG